MYKPELTLDSDFNYCLKEKLPVAVLDACTGTIIDKGIIEYYDQYSFNMNGKQYRRNQWLHRVYVAY